MPDLLLPVVLQPALLTIFSGLSGLGALQHFVSIAWIKSPPNCSRPLSACVLGENRHKSSSRPFFEASRAVSLIYRVFLAIQDPHFIWKNPMGCEYMLIPKTILADQIVFVNSSASKHTVQNTVPQVLGTLPPLLHPRIWYMCDWKILKTRDSFINFPQTKSIQLPCRFCYFWMCTHSWWLQPSRCSCHPR